MISLYTAMALAAISLPLTLRSASHPLAPIASEQANRALDLPVLPRLNVATPPPARQFDAALPNFIQQPTPLLDVIHPAIDPSEELLHGLLPRHPAPATPNR